MFHSSPCSMANIYLYCQDLHLHVYNIMNHSYNCTRCKTVNLLWMVRNHELILFSWWDFKCHIHGLMRAVKIEILSTALFYVFHPMVSNAAQINIQTQHDSRAERNTYTPTLIKPQHRDLICICTSWLVPGKKVHINTHRCNTLFHFIEENKDVFCCLCWKYVGNNSRTISYKWASLV